MCFPQDSPNASVWDNLNFRVIVVGLFLTIFFKILIIGQKSTVL